MMRFWLNRYVQPTPVASGLVVSTLVHGVLIAAAVVVTQPDPDAPEADVPVNSIARFLAPPNRSASQRGQAEMIRYVSVVVPERVIANVPRVEIEQVAEEPRPLGLDPMDAPALEELVGTDSVFSQVEVDSAASRYEWSAAPAYPPTMLAQQQGGFVRAEWVVDEAGVADTTTLRIVESSHPEFTKAVRDALPFMRFRPAKIGSRPVRQLVHQPFYFRVTTATADTTRVPPRRPGS